MKAKTIQEATSFTDIPNVGLRVCLDLKFLGFKQPLDLIGQDGFLMYKKLCRKTKIPHNPCLLDTFLAIADFANGGVPKKWFRFTKIRKEKYKI